MKIYPKIRPEMRHPLKDLGGEPAALELLQFPQLPVEPPAFRRIMDILILGHLIAIGYPLEQGPLGR